MLTVYISLSPYLVALSTIIAPYFFQHHHLVAGYKFQVLSKKKTPSPHGPTIFVSSGRKTGRSNVAGVDQPDETVADKSKAGTRTTSAAATSSSSPSEDPVEGTTLVASGDAAGATPASSTDRPTPPAGAPLPSSSGTGTFLERTQKTTSATTMENEKVALLETTATVTEEEPPCRVDCPACQDLESLEEDETTPPKTTTPGTTTTTAPSERELQENAETVNPLTPPGVGLVSGGDENKNATNASNGTGTTTPEEEGLQNVTNASSNASNGTTVVVVETTTTTTTTTTTETEEAASNSNVGVAKGSGLEIRCPDCEAGKADVPNGRVFDCLVACNMAGGGDPWRYNSPLCGEGTVKNGADNNHCLLDSPDYVGACCQFNKAFNAFEEDDAFPPECAVLGNLRDQDADFGVTDAYLDTDGEFYSSAAYFSCVAMPNWIAEPACTDDASSCAHMSNATHEGACCRKGEDPNNQAGGLCATDGIVYPKADLIVDEKIEKMWHKKECVAVSTTTTTPPPVCLCYNGVLDGTNDCPADDAQLCESCNAGYELREDVPNTGQKSCYPKCGGVTCEEQDSSTRAFIIPKDAEDLCELAEGGDLAESEWLVEGTFPQSQCEAFCCPRGCSQPTADTLTDLEERVLNVPSDDGWRTLLTSTEMLPGMDDTDAIENDPGTNCNLANYIGDDGATTLKFYCPVANQAVQVVGCDTLVVDSTPQCGCENGERKAPETTSTCDATGEQDCDTCNTNYSPQQDWPAGTQTGCAPQCGDCTAEWPWNAQTGEWYEQEPGTSTDIAAPCPFYVDGSKSDADRVALLTDDLQTARAKCRDGSADPASPSENLRCCVRKQTCTQPPLQILEREVAAGSSINWEQVLKDAALQPGQGAPVEFSGIATACAAGYSGTPTFRCSAARPQLLVEGCTENTCTCETGSLVSTTRVCAVDGGQNCDDSSCNTHYAATPGWPAPLQVGCAPVCGDCVTEWPWNAETGEWYEQESGDATSTESACPFYVVNSNANANAALTEMNVTITREKCRDGSDDSSTPSSGLRCCVRKQTCTQPSDTALQNVMTGERVYINWEEVLKRDALQPQQGAVEFSTMIASDAACAAGFSGTPTLECQNGGEELVVSGCTPNECVCHNGRELSQTRTCAATGDENCAEDSCDANYKLKEGWPDWLPRAPVQWGCAPKCEVGACETDLPWNPANGEFFVSKAEGTYCGLFFAEGSYSPEDEARRLALSEDSDDQARVRALCLRGGVGNAETDYQAGRTCCERRQTCTQPSGALENLVQLEDSIDWKNVLMDDSLQPNQFSNGEANAISRTAIATTCAEDALGTEPKFYCLAAGQPLQMTGCATNPNVGTARGSNVEISCPDCDAGNTADGKVFNCLTACAMEQRQWGDWTYNSPLCGEGIVKDVNRDGTTLRDNNYCKLESDKYVGACCQYDRENQNFMDDAVSPQVFPPECFLMGHLKEFAGVETAFGVTDEYLDETGGPYFSCVSMPKWIAEESCEDECTQTGLCAECPSGTGAESEYVGACCQKGFDSTDNACDPQSDISFPNADKIEDAALGNRWHKAECVLVTTTTSTTKDPFAVVGVEGVTLSCPRCSTNENGTPTGKAHLECGSVCIAKDESGTEDWDNGPPKIPCPECQVSSPLFKAGCCEWQESQGGFNEWGQNTCKNLNRLSEKGYQFLSQGTQDEIENNSKQYWSCVAYPKWLDEPSCLDADMCAGGLGKCDKCSGALGTPAGACCKQGEGDTWESFRNGCSAAVSTTFPNAVRLEAIGLEAKEECVEIVAEECRVTSKETIGSFYDCLDPATCESANNCVLEARSEWPMWYWTKRLLLENENPANSISSVAATSCYQYLANYFKFCHNFSDNSPLSATLNLNCKQAEVNCYNQINSLRNNCTSHLELSTESRARLNEVVNDADNKYNTAC
ncbi:unnamed protein product [Amoebophrya sp. A120]|nr:unnamed protein product [Amoebophrya sp. A120]|eukprot:GSA120T00023298001.1